MSCFGYQIFSNAKFGRIECHEAINAFAREILLDAKERLEERGWRVVHGIVDSIWVTPREGVEQQSLDSLAEDITTEAGALTKYFGSVADEDDYKYRGIECRQRSTSAFVADVQRKCIEAYDKYRSPEAVCDRVGAVLRRLREGDVDPEELAVKSRVSKHVEEYHHSTRTVAALEAAADTGRDVQPGQSVEYIVVDDTKPSQDRVALVGEAERYDAEYDAEQVARAAESVLSPLGWRESEIRGYLADREDASLSLY